MAQRIEPGLLAGGYGFEEELGQVPTYEDDLDFDTPIQRLADHAGINLEQSSRALDWFRAEEKESVFEAAAEMVGKLFDSLIPRKNRKSDAVKLSSVGMRLIAARVLMNRDGSQSLTEWASRAKCSKQLLCWHLKQIEDSTNLHWLGGKRFETRAIYSESARARWAALTPEERKVRRRGAQSATPDLTTSAGLE